MGFYSSLTVEEGFLRTMIFGLRKIRILDSDNETLQIIRQLGDARKARLFWIKRTLANLANNDFLEE